MAGHALLLAAGAAVALAPAAIRNRVVAGEWLLVSSHGGLNFYIGNNPDADGTYHRPAGRHALDRGADPDTRRVAEAAAGRSLTDSEVSDHFYRQALRWMRDRPADAIALFVRKLALAFHSSDIPLNYSYAYWSRDEPTLLRALVVGPWLLVPCGIAGFVVPRAADRRAFLDLGGVHPRLRAFPGRVLRRVPLPPAIARRVVRDVRRRLVVGGGGRWPSAGRRGPGASPPRPRSPRSSPSGRSPSTKGSPTSARSGSCT